MPFDVVIWADGVTGPDRYDAAGLAAYATVVLPDVHDLTEQQRAVVAEYVAGGGTVVVTDRCWSFLTTWLLHTRTLPGLYPPDIQPRAELTRAREAQAILAGTPRGQELARRLGVRFLVVDPTCPDPEGVPLEPPGIGTPVFVSERLVVLRIGAG